MFRLDKRKIFLLYQYFACGEHKQLYSGSNIQKIAVKNEKASERAIWFDECLKKENFLSEKITKKLKTGWEFSHLPPLERAILIYASYELLFSQASNYSKMIIDQIINFSKVYLEDGKYKYINKILDLLMRGEKVNYSPI